MTPRRPDPKYNPKDAKLAAEIRRRKDAREPLTHPWWEDFLAEYARLHPRGVKMRAKPPTPTQAPAPAPTPPQATPPATPAPGPAEGATQGTSADPPPLPNVDLGGAASSAGEAAPAPSPEQEERKKLCGQAAAAYCTVLKLAEPAIREAGFPCIPDQFYPVIYGAAERCAEKYLPKDLDAAAADEVVVIGSGAVTGGLWYFARRKLDKLAAQAKARQPQAPAEKKPPTPETIDVDPEGKERAWQGSKFLLVPKS